MFVALDRQNHNAKKLKTIVLDFYNDPKAEKSLNSYCSLCVMLAPVYSVLDLVNWKFGFEEFFLEKLNGLEVENEELKSLSTKN